MYNKGNYKDLELFFNDICWDKEFRGLDVEECHSKWLLINEKGCKIHSPELMMSSNNQNRVKKNVLWMTKELKSMCNNKRDHWFRCLNSGFKNPEDLKKYKKLNKQIKKQVKRNIRDFEENLALN